MATTAFRSVSTDQYNNAASTTFVVNAPAGLTNGDILLIAAFNPENVSHGMTITGSGWDTLGTQNVITNAYSETVWIKIASGEPASYTVTLTGVGVNFCAVAVCWDASLMNPAPSGALNTKVQTNNPALFVNSIASRWRVMACFDACGSITSQLAFNAAGWTLLGDEFSYTTSPAVGGQVAVFEKYCSSDFPSITWTITGGGANDITEQYSYSSGSAFGTAGDQDHWGWVG